MLCLRQNANLTAPASPIPLFHSTSVLSFLFEAIALTTSSTFSKESLTSLQLLYRSTQSMAQEGGITYYTWELAFTCCSSSLKLPADCIFIFINTSVLSNSARVCEGQAKVYCMRRGRSVFGLLRGGFLREGWWQHEAHSYRDASRS